MHMAAEGSDRAPELSDDQAAPEALRHVRSLVRQLSSQLKRPAEADDATRAAGVGESAEGSNSDGNHRAKRVCHERLPHVLEGLASVERMLAKIGEELEVGCGTFRSGAEVEQALASSARLCKQKRVLRVVTLRCQRLLQCLSDSKQAEGKCAPPSHSLGVAPPVSHLRNRPDVPSASPCENAPRPPGAAGLAFLRSAIDGARRWMPLGSYGKEPFPSGNPSDIEDVSPLNVSTLPDGRRVLLLFCSPLRAPLDCTVEMSNLQKAGLLPLSPAPMQGGSFDDLRKALRGVQPHILWFAGHGDARQADGRRTLGFSSDSGEIELFDPVSVAHELRPYLPIFGGNLECIVLNACSTGGCAPAHDPAEARLGDLLKQCGAPSVICWGSPADNSACAAFAAGLGAALTQTGDAVPGSVLSGYSEAYQRGKREILAVKMAGAQPGVQTQRYELVDPTDEARVVQPAESPPRPRREVYRVRSGPGVGRVAAGVPRLLENAGTIDTTRASGRRAMHGHPHGKGSSAGGLRGSALLVAVLVVVITAALGSLWLVAEASPSHAGFSTPRRFIAVDQLGHLHLDRGALEALRAAPSPVCVLSVAGPTREGKSTLVNAMMAALRKGVVERGWEDFSWFGTRTDGVATDGAASAGWMWLSGPLNRASMNATAGEATCGSVMLVDTAGITGNAADAGYGSHFGVQDASGANAPFQLAPSDAEAAQQRLLSFLLLTSSRVVMSLRRQPRVDLLERLVAAAAAAIAVRPPTATDLLSSSLGSGGREDVEARGCTSADCSAALPPPASVAIAGGPTSLAGAGAELMMLLRDSNAQLSEGVKRLTDRQVLEQWLPGPAGAAVDASVKAWQLHELAPPGAADLDALDRLGPHGYAAAHLSPAGDQVSSWGSMLYKTADALTIALRAPHGWDGLVAEDGQALASWMEHAVGSLNQM